jgi:CHAD domain-containing protein
MTNSDTQFDPQRFAWLKAKAEANNLSDDEIQQLREQVEAFQQAISSMVAALSTPIRAVREIAHSMTDTQHPRVQEIHENHRHRHDHTDVTPRCDGCGRFLPADQERVMCECGTPTFRWVE